MAVYMTAVLSSLSISSVPLTGLSLLRWSDFFLQIAGDIRLCLYVTSIIIWTPVTVKFVLWEAGFGYIALSTIRLCSEMQVRHF
jgi:hypothetical protein